MTAVEPVGNAVDLILLHDVGIIEVGIVHGDTEVKHHVHTCPVAESDGHAIRIVLVEALDILLVLLHIGTEFLLVGLIHIRHGIEGCLHIHGDIQLQGIPDLCLEVVEVLLLLSSAVELQIGCHIAQQLTVLTTTLQEL